MKVINLLIIIIASKATLVAVIGEETAQQSYQQHFLFEYIFLFP